MADERLPTLEERMYPNEVEQAMTSNLNANIPRLCDHFGYTAQEETKLRELHVSEMKETISASDAAKIHDLITRYTMKPASDEDSAKWGPEGRAWLRHTYGPDADKMLAEAQALVNSRPEFAKMIGQANLHNHPELLKAVVRKVRRKKGWRE